MKKVFLVFAALMVALSAQAGRWSVVEESALKYLETPAGQKFLSALVGKPHSEIAAMSAQARKGILMAELQNIKDDAFAQEVTQAFRSLDKNGEQLERLMNKSSYAKYFGKSDKVSALSLLEGKKVNHTQAAREMLAERVASGEIKSADADQFIQTVETANKALGFEILGKGVKGCMKLFPAKLVNNFMSLTSSLKGSALASTPAAFKALVAKSKQQYVETTARAEERVCGLAGQGYSCQILDARMCAL